MLLGRMPVNVIPGCLSTRLRGSTIDSVATLQGLMHRIQMVNRKNIRPAKRLAKRLLMSVVSASYGVDDFGTLADRLARVNSGLPHRLSPASIAARLLPL
jgi:hypothetical protein